MCHILEVKDLCKTYVVNHEEKYVLKNIELNIKEGEFVSIMGPSGSGKSTLIYNISGMDRMTSGSIIFEGNQLDNVSEKDLSKLRLNKMGFVFQQVNLLKNLGIMDNIILSAFMAKKKKRKEIINEAIALMEKADILELANNDITQASGGELQRASICRALMNHPKIIFADEPTGALNSKAANEIMAMFNKINDEGTTIMLVTHDAKIASQTERVLYMVDGTIEAELFLGKYREKNNNRKKREARLTHWLLEKGW
ncbi:putative ABC transport system ATP-binding protein [Natranaerovirga hydrolytica]|uniref:Putative ABC transport system ATP-binding protein n=1 Tax=Natranaerovirga hydrolytica TaxID=680378 RepID=A0A4V2Q071_9FIRM|nr:ABC transporter ATP-binding protein [Natranaerovirga hydrolytica]TCK92641.1 putative ABC transport system ATP-binding protein [Natranaerovirga hydrolytica]